MSYIGSAPSRNTPAYKQVYEFVATAAQTTFSVAYTVGFVEVYRNGVKLGAPNFTANNGTSVVLTSGANAGDFIQIVSEFINPVLNAIPNTTGAVATSNIADNAITTAKIAAGAVVQADLASGVAGTGPAFSAYLLNDMTLSSNTSTKVQLVAKSFDTANCFDNVTNYRFTPNVAGYYQFNYIGQFQGASASTFVMLSIFKNGSTGSIAPYHQGVRTPNSTTANMVYGTSVLLYANGTTDYFELYAQQSSGGNLALYSFNGGGSTYFQGFLVRAA